MQNILKSIFITTLPVISALVFFFGCYILIINSNYDLQNVGVLIISFTITFFFIRIYIKPLSRTSKYLTSYSVPILIGVIVSAIGLTNGIKTQYTIGSNVLIIIGWLLYLKWYSIFNNRENTILKVGNKLPEFELESYDKHKIQSSSFIGNPTIFMFYRGNWCPFCVEQVKELGAYHEDLQKRNVKTVLISPQPHNNTKSLAKNFNKDFNFLVDYKSKAAKQLGILSRNGLPAGFQILGYDSDTVLPTVLITDHKGTIVFADLTENYRIRPEPENFLNIIDSIK